MSGRALDRETLERLLGLRAERGVPGVRAEHGAVDRGGFVQEELLLLRESGAIPATRLRPKTPGPHPAVLYCHAHGNAWHIGRKELVAGRPALGAGPYGPALAEARYVVLCLDMPGHGDRQGEGTEITLAKAAFWNGRTLLGRMLADLGQGLDLLCADPGIESARVGALGLSMGATLAYWLAALDDRVTAVAHLCVFADIAPLIGAGDHDLHGIYMTVPGLLAHGDMGDVAALIAPRPQFVGAGRRDPLTPASALDPAVSRLRAAYAAHGAAAQLQVHLEDGTGHEETPRMRAAVLRFLAETLSQTR